MKKTFYILSILVLLLLIIGAFFMLRVSDTEENIDVPGRSFFPFGETTDSDDLQQDDFQVDIDIDPTIGDIHDHSTEFTETQHTLLSITDRSVAGISFVPNATTSPRIRYVEKETGHIYEYNLSTQQEVRLSNTTIPRIVEVLWGNNATSILLRSLDEDGETITSFLGQIETTSTSTLLGVFLQPNIKTIALSPTQHEIFYLTPTSQGVSGTLRQSDGIESVVFQSPLQEWLVEWINADSVLLTTKPSGEALGQTQLLNIRTGETTAVVHNKFGLTSSVYKNTESFIFGVGMNLYTSSLSEDNIELLTLRTLPEKCTWVDATSIICGIPNEIPRGVLPDVWYQGEIQFNDSIWKIDLTSGLTEFISSPNALRRDFVLDTVKMHTSPSGSEVAFINRTDDSLWLLSLETPEI